MRSVFFRSWMSIFIGAFCFLASGACLSAQDLPSPKDMFEKDYVQPKENSHHSTSNKSGKPETKPAAATPQTTASAAEERLQEVFQELGIEDPRTDQEKGTLKTYQKKKLTSLGAVLNASDSKHFKNELEKLIAYLRQTKLAVGTIYALGIPQEVDTKLSFFISIRGGKIQFVEKLPEQYAALNLSPTWLLQTDKDEVMIEGVEDFRLYLTEAGEYTGPK